MAAQAAPFSRSLHAHIRFVAESGGAMVRRLTNKRIRRGVFRSVRELASAIREYIRVHNEDPKPFVWTRTADQILDSMARYARRTLTSHPSRITSRINVTGDYVSSSSRKSKQCLTFRYHIRSWRD